MPLVNIVLLEITHVLLAILNAVVVLVLLHLASVAILTTNLLDLLVLLAWMVTFHLLEILLVRFVI